MKPIVVPHGEAELEPGLRRFLAQARKAVPLEAMSLDEARAATNGLKLLQEEPEDVASVSASWVAAKDGYMIPVRIYHPNVAMSVSLPLPIVVFAHGGGWFSCTLDLYDSPCRALANAGAAIVISVDYRLSPEYKFPTAVEDFYAVACWASANAVLLGGNPTALVVAGDSAGGNLAAACALMARDRQGPAIAQQLLFYPVTDCNFETESYTAFAEGFGLTRAAMMLCWKYYLEREEQALDPLAAPLRASSLAGLPQAAVFTCEFDVLRDEGEAYAMRLRSDGVDATHVRLPGMLHACMNMTGLTSKARHLFDLSGLILRSLGR